MSKPLEVIEKAMERVTRNEPIKVLIISTPNGAPTDVFRRMIAEEATAKGVDVIWQKDFEDGHCMTSEEFRHQYMCNFDLHQEQIHRDAMKELMEIEIGPPPKFDCPVERRVVNYNFERDRARWGTKRGGRRHVF